MEKNTQSGTKFNQQMIQRFDNKSIDFLVSVKRYHKTETKNNININLSRYENKQAYPLYLLKNGFKDHKKLLLLQILKK